MIYPGTPGEPDPRTHEGYEWLYVLSGRLRMVLADHDVVLNPGEVVEFDTRVPHWFGAADGGPVEILSLFGKRGERMHVRTKPAHGQLSVHADGGTAVAPPGTVTTMAWLPEGFAHPTTVPVLDGYHLRPIRATDVDIDYPAVMGSRERLWSIYGEAWRWPPPTMTFDADREDLARHEREAEAHESFNYALLNLAETELLGCVYVDPPSKRGADAEISWWVVDAYVGSTLEDALDVLVPRWIAGVWPFEKPRYVGRDLTWREWLALPAVDETA